MKLKVGDIVYIAELDRIEQVMLIGNLYYLFRYNESEWIDIVHEQMDLGFIIKLEL